MVAERFELVGSATARRARRVLVAAALFAGAYACSSQTDTPVGGAGGADAGTAGIGGGPSSIAAGHPCVHLRFQPMACSGKAKTTLSGTGYTTEGTLPPSN